MSKHKMRKELIDELKYLHKEGVGKPKHEVKNEFNASPLIHSDVTFQTYKQQVNQFCDWAYQKGVKFKPEDYRFKKLVCDYIKFLVSENKSAWSVSTALCAIAKASHMSTKDFKVDIPKRRRSDVTRSRYETETDKHVSKAHNEAIINFCKCAGLRRHELEKLTTSDFEHAENGLIKVKIKSGKGGKGRIVYLFGTQTEINKIEKLIADKEGKVFEKIPKNLDIHSYRAIYASRAYQRFARPIDTIPPEDKYICRKDKAGIVYDRSAMRKASFLLGHNRVDVIANSYLHTLA